MGLFRLVMAVLVLGTGAPLLARLCAGAISRVSGCTLDMTSVEGCVVGGTELSGVLLALGTVSGLLFATLPFLVALLLAWVLTEFAHRYVTRRL